MGKRTRYTMTSQQMERVSVMKRLESRDLGQQAASEILGVSVRQVKGLWKKYEVFGSQGLISLHVGGNRAFTQDFNGQVLEAMHKSYSEKLLEREHLSVNHETLRCWMMEDGLWKGRKRKAARIQQSRDRRPQYGDLVQIDGSHHAWFEDRAPKCCAFVFIDDAT